MSYSTINRVILIGNLTRDPELRALPSGRSVCSLRIACNASRSDGEGGYVDRPNFFDVSVFGVQAENAGQYLRKGRRVAVDGSLEWREWEGQDGAKRQAVSVVADLLLFLDGSGGAQNGEDELTGVGAESEGVPF
jgi:single-strand DNA-binding protein